MLSAQSLALALLFIPAEIMAESQSVLTTKQQTEAAGDAVGFACAVQAGDANRAFAWAGDAIMSVMLLDRYVSRAASDEWAKRFMAGSKRTARKERPQCSGISQTPNWP